MVPLPRKHTWMLLIEKTPWKSPCCHFPGTCAKHWELHGESFWIKTSAKFSSCCAPCKLRADENDMVHCLLNPFPLSAHPWDHKSLPKPKHRFLAQFWRLVLIGWVIATATQTPSTTTNCQQLRKQRWQWRQSPSQACFCFASVAYHLSYVAYVAPIILFILVDLSWQFTMSCHTSQKIIVVFPMSYPK